MDKHKEEQLLYRISELIKENKELTKQLKEANNEKDKLSRQNEKLENIIAQVPSQHLPDGTKYPSKSRSLRFDMATVLYADVQGLRRIANQSATTDVMDELDNIFLEFNKIVKKYKIEKIKTIGDAYMCAGGVPEKNITNPVDVALAAMEMQDYMNNLKEEYESQEREFWDFRIGIHTGSVTANFHGRKKLSYDLKGDTVK